MQLMVQHSIGPKCALYLAIIGIPIAFVLGLNNSVMYYEMLPKNVNSDVLVFYQPSCPHCIAELSTIKRLVSNGYNVSAFNVFKYPNLTEKYGITETPTLIVHGIKMSGEHSYSEIVKVLNGKVGEFVPSENGTGCQIGGSSKCSPM